MDERNCCVPPPLIICIEIRCIVKTTSPYRYKVTVCTTKKEHGLRYRVWVTSIKVLRGLLSKNTWVWPNYSTTRLLRLSFSRCLVNLYISRVCNVANTEKAVSSSIPFFCFLFQPFPPCVPVDSISVEDPCFTPSITFTGAHVWSKKQQRLKVINYR